MNPSRNMYFLGRFFTCQGAIRYSMLNYDVGSLELKRRAILQILSASDRQDLI
jgi:hypothetical protein